MSRSPSKEQPTLSVVMPTRGRRDRLDDVLSPLLGDPTITEIVVVVDGDVDGSAEVLRSRTSDDRRLVPIVRETRGGAQIARDEGLRHASGEIVLFLDDDVRADPGLASGHREHHVVGNSQIVVGYMPVKFDPFRRSDDFTSRLYSAEYEGRCEAYEADPSEILRTLWWGNVSMRREDVLAVGLVSTGLEALYHEDQDFGLRCLAMGFTATFDRRLRATHLHQRDLAGFVRDADSQGRGSALVHLRHADIVGALSPADFERDLGPVLRIVVRAGGHEATAATVITLLEGLIRSAGWCRWWKVQSSAARLLRRVAQRRGAEDMWRNAPSSQGGAPR